MFIWPRLRLRDEALLDLVTLLTQISGAMHVY
jgi:hypothetical protein